LDTQDGLGFLPEIVELVERTFFFGEDVDNNIPIIQQYPAGIGGPFAVEGLLADLFEGMYHLFGDGFKLARRVAGGHDEIIGEAADVMRVQQDNIGGQLIAGDIYYAAGFV
jgi:hypothetical protein